MSINQTVLEILNEENLCPYCLGRLFALLATNTTNLERGTSLLLSLTMEFHQNYLMGNKELESQSLQNLKLLAEKVNFLPAQKVLEKEGFSFDLELANQPCYLCQDIFKNKKQYIDGALFYAESYEFDHFLCGTSPSPEIINKEDRLKAKFELLEAEAFKSHFNREIGRTLSQVLKKPVEFSNPHIVFIFNLSYDNFSIDMTIKSLFIFGRYNKLIRGIPQTKWICSNCHGKGCSECDQTGKRYPSSVQELISEEFEKAAKTMDSKFHGAGREDIDVRMLGDGRPFVIELLNPRVRTLNLEELKRKINESNPDKIKINALHYSDKNEVIKMKENSEFTRKTYKALVKTENSFTEEEFAEKLTEIKEKLVDQEIEQRTPQRVAHRRADLVREKAIFSIEAKYIDSNNSDFTIETQGGTYIKELIHGDEGRTTPSFADIFKSPTSCVQLDVINIDYKRNHF